MKQSVITDSVRETIEYAERFGRTLVGGEVVLLRGDMGAGKTHFAKGVAAALEIADVITSPTFAIHNCYYGRLTLNHFDFYRIEDSAEAEMLGLDEFFYDPKAITLIEWSENISDLLPNDCICVTIKKLGENRREIIIERSV